MSARRKARELTLKALYAYEISGSDAQQVSDDIISVSQIKEEAKRFSRILFKKVLQNIEKIDDLIKGSVKSWDFSRIGLVEKNILRIGVCELLFFSDIPVAITINEAIELGKKYGGKDAKNFINGVLDYIAKALEKEHSVPK
ncbi:MAG: transcription antitermination factor NusB [candidate division Zixibacteria bacterium]|nr:transcription antitermination factor NusB [candidate division Zixibacteria bacterium]